MRPLYITWRNIAPWLLVMGLFLSACDFGGGSPTPTALPGTTAGDATPLVSPTGMSITTVGGEDSAGPKLDRSVSGDITFWHFWQSPVRRNAIKRVIAICGKQLPGIRVTDEAKPFSEIWNANIAAVDAGAGMPDVIVEDRPQLPSRAENEVDQSLQQLAERDGIDGSQFWPFTWKQTLYNNETYGIPYETDVRVMYWNKNAFREAGLDPEKPPATWQELEDVADKLDRKNPDGTFDRIAFFPMINVGADVWAYTNGLQEWIGEDGKPHLNDPAAVETFEWIKKWVDRYGGWDVITKFRSGFGAAPQDPFMSGDVAMYVDINGYSSQLNFFRPTVLNAEGKSVSLEWGVTHIPQNKGNGSSSGGFALSIPRGAKNTEAAWEFIKCATGPEAQTSWARDTYAMPANIEAAKDPEVLADPNWQLFLDAMDYTRGGNFLPGYPNWKEQLEQRYVPIWKGEIDIKTALDQAQQAVEEELKK